MTRRLMRATVALVPTDQGGRATAIESGYRSLIRFDGTRGYFGFELTLDGPFLAPGARGGALLAFWAVDDLPKLSAGRGFELLEGRRVVGHGTIENFDAAP